MEQSKKTAVVFGVVNQRSLAWGVVQQLLAEGVQVGLGFLPDERGKMEGRVRDAVGTAPVQFIAPCDLNKDQDLEQFFARVRTEFPQGLDFVVHSVAYAPTEDVRAPVSQVSRSGFAIAMEASVYSFLACTRFAKPCLRAGGSLLTMSYLGGERVVPGYNVMGLCKAALESAVRYLAWELGELGIRVNALSPGPVKTLAASAIGDFGRILALDRELSPLRRNTTQDDVGKAAAFLLQSSGITGEIVHVDGGMHTMGTPPLPQIKNTALS